MKDYSFRMPGSSDKGIVLVHGLTGAPPEMRFLAKRLNKMGFTCDAPMMAGHCVDMPTLLKTNYQDWVRSVQDAILRLKQDVAQVYVAGICVGGGVGLLAAHQLPAGTVEAAAIYSPTLVYNGWGAPWWHEYLHWMVPLVTPLPLSRKIGFAEAHPFGLKSDRIRTAVTGNSGDGIDGTLPVFPLKGLNENFRLNKAIKKALPTMTLPLLLVHSREDDVSSPQNAETIKKLHGGRCEIAWLEDSYHKVHIDQERQKAAEYTADFFGMPQDAHMPQLAEDAA